MDLRRITYGTDIQPFPGQYLVSRGPRARAAYLIHQVRGIVSRTSGAVERYALGVERIGHQDIPPDAVVLDLYWSPRRKKRR